jgi:MFS family permease
MVAGDSGRMAGKALLPEAFDEREAQILDLYKYYEEVGNSAKSQMTSTATWLLAVISGLFSYTINQGFGWPLCLKDSEAAYLAGLLGVVVCVLNLFMIDEFWRHTKRNWWRATRCKYELPELHRLVTGRSELGPPPAKDERDFQPEGTRVASIFTFYRIFTFGFLVLMLIALAVHFFSSAGSCPLNQGN